MTELITVGLGQHTVLQTREKSIDGKLHNAKSGKFMGGFPPLGYDVIGREYVVNEKEADIVRLIFKLYAAGKSYNHIIDCLKPYRTKRGRAFGKNSLQSILRNERYIGVFTFAKYHQREMRRWVGKRLNDQCVRIEDAVPRIIDQYTWERVAKRMSDNKRKQVNKARREYLLSGLIECVECGSKFVGHCSTNKKGYQTPYYCCGAKYRTHECDAKNINGNQIEEFVVMTLKNYLNTVDYTELANTIADAYNNASPDLSAERRELQEVETKISNGVKAVLSGIDLLELKEEIEQLQARKHELEEIIAHNMAKEREKVSPDEIIAYLQDSNEIIKEGRIKEAIQRHIQKIYAYPSGDYSVEIGVHTIGSSGRA